MDRLFLNHLNPAAVDPETLVNRDDDAQWLHDGLLAYLRSDDPGLGGAFCILGEKGIGKSILTRKVLADLQQIHAATTVFVTVDCRPLRSQRDVYREVASKLVDELTIRQDVSEPLRAAARAFDDLTRFDEASLKYVHEHLIQHQVGLDLGGSTSFFKWLEAKLGVVISLTKKVIDTLQGSITIDGPRLREALVRLLADIHTHARLRVVLYLDNIEELDHEAMRDEVTRERVRGEIEALLELSEAPLGLVLNMRTYYASVLDRRISRRRTLGRLSEAEHLEIFERRVARESPVIRARVREQAIAASMQTLAALARTPLAFLSWAEFMLEEGLCDQPDAGAALQRRLGTHYATVSRQIPKVVALFASIEDTVEIEAVRAACDQHDSVVRQLLDHQVLLPVNYWDPREFLLDPELGFLVGRSG